MAPRKKTLTREEKLQRKRDSERKRYERMKNDPQKREELREKERLKYLKKKEKGSRKLVKDMTPREHRETKKKWKEHCKKYREKNKAVRDITQSFVKENTPDSIASEVQSSAPIPPMIPKQKSDMSRKLRYIKMKKKNEEIVKLKKKLSKYKKRLSRLEKKKQDEISQKDTPNTKLQNMMKIDTPEARKDLVKKALFGEVLKEQLKENLYKSKTVTEKRLITKIVSGDLVDKYKLWRIKGAGVVNYKRIQRAKVSVTRTRKLSDKAIAEVMNFYQDDSNSRLGAGKKEFITRKKLRKQKRYLLDSLLGLYKKFNQTSHVKISYQTFCKLRPFWVVVPKLGERDTCLCITHANVDLKLTALHSRKILSYNSHPKLLEELCCNRFDEQCLTRECKQCMNRTPSYREFHDNIPIAYKKWVVEKQEYLDPKTKKSRQVAKHMKKSFTVQPRQLIEALQEELDKFLIHERNIVHQFSAIKKLKRSLTEEDALIHMDFSENYSTKYGQEIQAFHFGGSRMQISLHTVVVYLKDAVKSYCTVSTNCAHSPAAIWTHLQVIFDSLPQTIKNLHFLSDGPVTQYRNKTMFYIMATKLPERFPNLLKFTWNYSESGHGKGAPDGIGATCKRTADAVIAAGRDIENIEAFIQVIEERCPAIILRTVRDQDIQEMTTDIEAKTAKLKSFTGTLKVHQVTGIFYSSLGLRFSNVVLVMKSLSCFCNEETCAHFNIGNMGYEILPRLNVDEVYTDSESELQPVAGPSNSDRTVFKHGDYVLVRVPGKNVEYRYVSVIRDIDDEDGELSVTFLKLQDEKGQTFKINEHDLADVTVDQVVEKLPSPNILLKGNRVFYKFDLPPNVFEK